MGFWGMESRGKESCEMAFCISEACGFVYTGSLYDGSWYTGSLYTGSSYRVLIRPAPVRMFPEVLSRPLVFVRCQPSASFCFFHAGSSLQIRFSCSVKDFVTRSSWIFKMRVRLAPSLGAFPSFNSRSRSLVSSFFCISKSALPFPRGPLVQVCRVDLVERVFLADPRVALDDLVADADQAVSGHLVCQRLVFGRRQLQDLT